MVITDPYAAAGGLDPSRMTAAERLGEAAAILGMGLARLRARGEAGIDPRTGDFRELSTGLRAPTERQSDGEKSKGSQI
ncbi:MAG: hypothetical protein HQ503_14735 [Rhodospirillales bacterium]|nr:hypothetical protein [Rhodospirillales bacterium]